MSIIFRATADFMERVRKDLSRTHSFAEERVGFITIRATSSNAHLLLLADGYYPVADNDYVPDTSVGAMLGQEAFRKMLEVALLNQVGVFHVHQHLFPGPLWFSRLDLREQLKFVPDFFKVRSNMPHGALVLSPDLIAGRTWLAPNRIERIEEFNTIGAPLRVSRSADDGSVDFYA